MQPPRPRVCNGAHVPANVEGRYDMSDGDNATPGLWGPAEPSDQDGTKPSQGSQRLTRSTPPGPGAAPWERAQGVLPPDRRPDVEGTGTHTDGVALADLIAKLANESGTGCRRLRSPAPQPTPPDPTVVDTPALPPLPHHATAAAADTGLKCPTDTPVIPILPL